MRKKIVAGNWKMIGTQESVATLLAALLADVAMQQPSAECVVFPPYVFLPAVERLLCESALQWGAQNLSANEPGAYTGEIAAPMIKELGCRYVLVGHSERRELFAEDNTLVAMKFAQAKHYGLTPILCIGETKQQRAEGQTETVLAGQLDAVLELNDGVALLQEAVVAYEPVWAIGSNRPATPEQAQAVHAWIRQKIAVLDKNIAAKLPILYGGSVKANNAAELFAMSDIDGGLVGGASLDATEFMKIIQCIK